MTESRHTLKFASPRCKAVTLMGDDHWGALPTYCELDEGHEGEHQRCMGACDPVAYLVWRDDDDGPLDPMDTRRAAWG